MKEFIVRDLDKFLWQNKADIVSFVEGYLLDNYVAISEKGNIIFIFEECVNSWSSRYHAYFFREYEQNSGECQKFWEFFENMEHI